MMNINVLHLYLFMLLLSTSCGKKHDLAGAGTVTEASEILFGAIRWDGWVGQKSEVGKIVERTLSPTIFHHRLPFYSDIVTIGDSTVVSIDGTTQEIIDKEIVYAKNAGIDYWAYVWYEDGVELELARKLHQSSIHSNDVKWCVILQTFETNISGNYGSALVEDFARENYQKVMDGRPLIYLYESDVTRNGLDKLRMMTTTRKLKNPYVVVMGWDVNSTYNYCAEIGADAISSYAELGKENLPYAKVIPTQSLKRWNEYAAVGQIVPWVCTGWNPKPRMVSDNPWSKYYSDDTNCQDARIDDLKDFLISAIVWTKSNRDKTNSNTILMYAWNEFDEGFGAICPTLGADGKPNTDRLDAISSVIHNYKHKEKKQ